MKDLCVTIKSIKEVSNEIYLLAFDAPYFVKKMKAGQFLDIKIDSPELNLRRPFCIHHTEGETVYVLFRIRGRGTELMSQMKAGDELDILGPLGTGFKIRKHSYHVLVAGGMGVAPLVSLAAKLAENRKSKVENNEKLIVLLGARSKEEVLCKKDFEKMGAKVLVATDDGSQGFKGNSVQLLEEQLKMFPNDIKDMAVYMCGPEIMFETGAKLLEEYPNIFAQASFEQFMGCGVGTCRACVINTIHGYRRACKDGPVFNLREVIFED